ncbi:hypothetical protein [Mangrovibacter phragmitis]|uniref:hypothetical protein n=1 Tax=Mangrovibacter phragmitis TaxID=1691903 RepID=UPI00336AA54B
MKITSVMKQRLMSAVSTVLVRWGVPRNQMDERIKKVGRGFLLVSILFVVPCAVWTDSLSSLVKIVLQLGFALCMFAGVLLAFDDGKLPPR